MHHRDLLLSFHTQLFRAVLQVGGRCKGEVRQRPHHARPLSRARWEHAGKILLDSESNIVIILTVSNSVKLNIIKDPQTFVPRNNVPPNLSAMLLPWNFGDNIILFKTLVHGKLHYWRSL